MKSRVLLAVAVLLSITIASVVYAQTSSTTTSTPSVSPTATPADTPPVISASVKSASDLHPTTIYAGLRSYFSVTITDDKGIVSASVTAPGMRYSPRDITLWQCANNVKSCSESAYIIVPVQSGPYALTFTATDSAGQTSTQTVPFTAQGCVTDTECGGTRFNSGTATYCNQANTQRLQGMTKAVCSAGVCSETLTEGVLDDCAAGGKICGFSPLGGGQYQCVVKPAASCVIGQPVTSACACGTTSSEGYGYCCLDSAGKAQLLTYVCPIVTPGAGAPEPANNDAGVWAQVEVATGQVVGSAICTKSVCGLNGDWHGYVPPGSYQTGSVWWPTSKRYIWELPGQAGYGSGTFNFTTYLFTVSGGTISNGVFTPTPSPTLNSSPTPSPSATASSTPSPSTSPNTPVVSPSSVSDPTLVGYWKFDGNGNNEAVGGPSAVAVGNAVFRSSGGKLDGYAYLPFSIDYVKIPYAARYDLGNAFTVEFWFRQRANQSFNQNLIYKGTPTNNYNFSIFRYLWDQFNSGPVIAGSTAAGSGYWTQVSNPNEPPHNAWHHVAYTKTTAAAAYYIDGALIHSRNYGPTGYDSEYYGLVKTPASDIIIGNPAPDTDIDNVRIYSRALSASEVAQNGGFPATQASPTPTVAPSPIMQNHNQLQTPTSTAPTAPVPTVFTTPFPVPAVPTPVPLPSPLLCPANSVFSSTTNQCLVQNQQNALQQCLIAGGAWCPGAGGNGYCVPAGTTCDRTPVPPLPPTGAAVPEPIQEALLKKIQAKQDEAATRETFLNDRNEILRHVREIERLVKREQVEIDANELKAVKAKLLSLKPGENIETSVLESYRQKVSGFQESARQNQAPSAATTVDAQSEATALRQMKQNVRQFERYLASIEAKMAQVEKSGIAVDASIKETVAKAKDMASKVKAAATYDDIRDIAEQIPEVGQSLNDAIPRLQELLRLPKIFRLVDRRIADASRAITQAQATAKRLKLDFGDKIDAMNSLLSQAKEAVAAIKASGTTDVIDELQDTVFARVDEILNQAEHIKTVANVRSAVNRAAADGKRYETIIRRKEKAGENMQSAYNLLDQFKEQVTGFRTASQQKLTPEAGDQIIEYVRALADTRDELDDLLHLATPDALEAQIKKLFSSATEKIESFDVGRLEQGVL